MRVWCLCGVCVVTGVWCLHVCQFIQVKINHLTVLDQCSSFNLYYKA